MKTIHSINRGFYTALESTQKFMLENNIRKLDRYTLLIFDEIGAVSVYPDNKFVNLYLISFH